MRFPHNQNPKLSSLLLRLGLAAVFLCAAYGSVFHPDDWVGYLPTFLEKMADAATVVRVFAVYEIALSLWLLSGKLIRYAALLSAATFVGIIISQLSGFGSVTFRDVGLAFMALALVFL